jgi:hypothetical protein
VKPSLRDIVHRLIGAGLLGGAVLSSFLHKALAAGGGQPTLAELALAITSFVLASVGVMLVINGAQLFDTPVRRRGSPHDQ